MICYQDKCWCDAKHCEKYEKCKKALPYAIKEQGKEVQHLDDFLPYAVRDMSFVCKEYE